MMVAFLGPIKRIATTRPTIAGPSRVEKCNGGQSRIASIMESARAPSSGGSPLDRTQAISARLWRRRPAKTDANRELVIGMRRPPAGGELRGDVMDAIERWLRVADLRWRPNASTTLHIEIKRSTSA
jgi:hypothetical protein